ncbi:trigger factor [Patescibacteria group bacterium]|nr:trigger factor [Patescibacteria group bacterium]
MITHKKVLPHSRIQLTVTVSADQFRHAFDHELNEYTKSVSLPGFRAGKAPKAKVLEQVGRPRIEAAALDHAISHVYYEAVQEADIRPVEGPEVTIEKYETPSDSADPSGVVATFKVEVDVMPEVKIDGYKKIKIKPEPEKPVAEDEVEKVITYLRKQQAALVEVEEDGALEEGMWADIAYEGSVGGVKRPDMANKNHPLVIGEGQLIPGFEDQIIGMKKGEKKKITVTFPKEYHAKELAGKKAEFEVAVNELKRVNLPEKDADFAKRFGHSTFSELEKAIRESIVEEKRQESRQKQEQEVLDQLLKLAKFDLPQSLVKQEMERMYAEAQERLSKMNFDWDAYLEQVKKTADQVREETRPQAEKNVRIGLALGKVVEAEGLAESEQAAQQAVERLYEIATSK